MTERFDVTIVGGGIVGLATARALHRRRPELRVAVLEKEAELGHHQTGHNSGVVHSGVAYLPGSLKATLTREGRAELLAFCARERIRTAPVGKLIVATRADELPELERLRARGAANGVPGVSRLDRAGLDAAAPGVAGLAALRVPSAAIVDYHEVAERLGARLAEDGVDVRRRAEVTEVSPGSDGWELRAGSENLRAGFVINCGGLRSDLLARQMGVDPKVQIVPFRGDFYELEGRVRTGVRTLVYPVPDPRFPFAGVHLTPTVDGRLLAGPNAAVAFDREGYRPSAFDLREAVRLASFPGTWSLLRENPTVAAHEWLRSWSPAEFLEGIRSLWPDVSPADLGARRSGVRAQAVRPDGTLEEDFVLLRDRAALHVVNAPSPAATASFAIAERVVEAAGFSAPGPA
jgi:(S)-2-hydroxyglutarate dehydrogenase